MEAWSPQAVIEVALEQVKRTKASWTAADLTAQIDAALPDTLGITDGADIARLLRTLTEEGLRQATGLHAPRPGDELLPADRRLANGASSYESPGGARYATPDQVRTERALVAATAAGGATALPAATARRYLDAAAGVGDRAGRRPGRRRVRGAHLRGADRVPGRTRRHREVVRGRGGGARLDRPHTRPRRPRDRGGRPGGSRRRRRCRGGCSGWRPPRSPRRCWRRRG